MLKNFFTVAIRNFLRQRLYSFLNILGLTTGLICVLLIFLWVSDVLQKDRFHQDTDRIFQVITNHHQDDGTILTWPITPGPLAEAVREDIAEVELAVRAADAYEHLFESNGKKFLEHGIYADPEFFSVFSFTVVKGKLNQNPEDISTVAISESLAHRLFGSSDVIGKAITVNASTTCSVSAVFKDTDRHSSIRFDFILPYAIYKNKRSDGYAWGNYDNSLYLKLTTPDGQRGTDQINALIESKYRDKNDDGIKFYLQNFADRNLYSNFENGFPSGGQIDYVIAFSFIAVQILLLACINFVNMATARSASRAKEVGVRKAVGAQRPSLMWQFIGESMLISAIAMIVAIAITFTILPFFNLSIGKELALDLSDPWLITGIIAIVLITGLLAGAYPAFFLSSFSPAKVLKSTSTSYVGGSSIRRWLIVFQFAITVVLIACTLVFYEQIEYIRNKKMGYDREQIITFAERGDIPAHFETFKRELEQIDGVVSVSRASESLINVGNQNNSVRWPGRPENSQTYFRTIVTDYDYLQTMGLKLVEGRYFVAERADTSSFIITQQTQDIMGLQHPIGVEISQWGTKGKIVGVVEDFHSRSLHQAIDPIIFMCQPAQTGQVFIKLDGPNINSAIKKIEQQYNKHTDFLFKYSFLDDQFDRMYSDEKVSGALGFGFTLMTIIISGLGMVGLAAFTAERRKKEISIRKTMGASVTTIILMMTKDFIKLSLIASIIGCPIAYFVMSRFLSGYEYSITLEWKTFILTAFASLIITITTVIIQVTRAAIVNPVDALRNE